VLITDPLFFEKYIEKAGSGILLDMIFIQLLSNLLGEVTITHLQEGDSYG
jgi:hypothetical protein